MKVVLITNGNFFSTLALRQVLHQDKDITWHVFITSGLRRPKGNKAAEAWRLFRVWGPAYTAYKVLTYALPAVGSRVLRRPLDVAAVCQARGIPVTYARNVNDESVALSIAELAPDLLVSYSCPYRIRPHLLATARLGCINVHSSLLPAYAGICTYVHVLACGESETGVTVHEMVEEFDAGRILSQERVLVEPNTSVAALFARQSHIAGRLLREVVEATLARGEMVGTPQDLAKRSYFGEPSRADIRQIRQHGHRLLRSADLRVLLSGRL
ncbi:MAG TPA: formyltransferase family protein [Acidimicrobiales bacterium]|nr:formyltransferase family protein [Acidimicrobiales bacterium]